MTSLEAGRRDALTTAQIAAMVSVLDLGTLAARRDRAVLLVGFVGGSRSAELAGLDPARLSRRDDGYVVALGRSVGIPPGRLAGHPLRAGHATTAAAHGAPDRLIMRQTGHRSVATLQGSIRTDDAARPSSADHLALDTP